MISTSRPEATSSLEETRYLRAPARADRDRIIVRSGRVIWPYLSVLAGLPEPLKRFSIESRNWGVKEIQPAQLVRDNVAIHGNKSIIEQFALPDSSPQRTESERTPLRSDGQGGSVLANPRP